MPEKAGPAGGSPTFPPPNRRTDNTAPVRDRLVNNSGVPQGFRTQATQDQVRRADAEVEVWSGGPSSPSARLQQLTLQLAPPGTNPGPQVRSVAESAPTGLTPPGDHAARVRDEFLSETEASQGYMTADRVQYYRDALQGHASEPAARDVLQMLARFFG